MELNIYTQHAYALEMLFLAFLLHYSLHSSPLSSLHSYPLISPSFHILSLPPSPSLSISTYMSLTPPFSLLYAWIGTFHQPKWKRDADAEYTECHIDGAVRFDFRIIRDKSNPMPLMLPSAQQFENQVGEVSEWSKMYKWKFYITAWIRWNPSIRTPPKYRHLSEQDTFFLPKYHVCVP